MSLYAALYRHRRDKWLWLTAAILHVAAFTVWQTTSADTHRDLERWFITVAMIMAIGFYGIIVAAFWVAQKTRLNKALALNKLFWGVLIAAIGLPAQTGWYDPAPQWVRAYIWVGLTLTISWVLYEFVHANWLRRDGASTCGETLIASCWRVWNRRKSNLPGIAGSSGNWRRSRWQQSSFSVASLILHLRTDTFPTIRRRHGTTSVSVTRLARVVIP